MTDETFSKGPALFPVSATRDGLRSAVQARVRYAGLRCAVRESSRATSAVEGCGFGRGDRLRKEPWRGPPAQRFHGSGLEGNRALRRDHSHPRGHRAGVENQWTHVGFRGVRSGKGRAGARPKDVSDPDRPASGERNASERVRWLCLDRQTREAGLQIEEIPETSGSGSRFSFQRRRERSPGARLPATRALYRAVRPARPARVGQWRS